MFVCNNECSFYILFKLASYILYKGICACLQRRGHINMINDASQSVALRGTNFTSASAEPTLAQHWFVIVCWINVANPSYYFGKWVFYIIRSVNARENILIKPLTKPAWPQCENVFSYKLRYIVGFGLVEMTISTNPKPTIYPNLYENTVPACCGSMVFCALSTW